MSVPATVAPRGIAGLAGREPIGAAITIGVKHGEKGYPIEKDRWHIVAATATDKVRLQHPLFTAFNELPAHARKVLRGNIVHASRDECFEFGLRNQQNGPMHPQGRPFCVGDGVRAIRWMGKDADDFQEIPCPHDRCEFRQRPAGNKPIPCKPAMRFLMRIDWTPELQAYVATKGKPPLPSMLVKYTSYSWNTVRNFIGLFDHVDNAARSLGIRSWTLFGLPILLELHEKTNTERQSRFPVVRATTTDLDPIQFFGEQRAALDRLGATPPIALTDESQRAPVLEAEDYAAISVPAS